jgi:hypothetical protein
MRKSQLSEWQLESRNLFVSRLGATGWDTRGWEILFAGDNELSPEAQAEYQNLSFNLRCSYFVADEYLLLEAVEKVGELALALRLYHSGDVQGILNAIIEWQDRLSDDNYPKFIDAVKPLCRHILLQTPDKLVEIT